MVRLDRSWQRLHACAHDAIYFNVKNTGRFNAPHEEYGVMYVGGDLACCFVETFGRLDTPAATTVRSVSEAQLRLACISRIQPTRRLALVDLTGPGLRRIGADARLFAGDYRASQQWGRALWAHPDRPDGILYPARHDPSLLSVALFNRARDAVQVSDTHLLSALDDAALAALLDRYNFSLRPWGAGMQSRYPRARYAVSRRRNRHGGEKNDDRRARSRVPRACRAGRDDRGDRLDAR